MGTDLHDACAVIDVLDRASQAMRDTPVRDHSVVRLPARGRLLVTGDLHDNPAHLAKILTLARLAESPDHHVIVHEMIHSDKLINGVDLSYRMLCRVAELVVQYPDQAHPLLANHELSQMTDAGVTKGSGNSVELFDRGLEYVFHAHWEEVEQAIERFIAAMAIALVSESGLWCSHSLPGARMRKYFDPEVISRELTKEDYTGPRGSAYQMVWGRGHTLEEIEELAGMWNVRLFCLGHQHLESGIECRGRKLIVLNSDHERGVVLPIGLPGDAPDAEQAISAAIPLSALPNSE